MNIQRLLETHSLSNETRYLAELFVSSRADGKRYLLGRNEHAGALATRFDIAAIVDDFAADGTSFAGKPVIPSNAIPYDGLLVNCSMSIRPVSAAAMSQRLSIGGAINYGDLLSAVPERTPVPRFVAETSLDVENHSSYWASVYRSLADDESRRIMEALVAFRLTADVRYMNDFSVRVSDQYFDDIVCTNASEVFVDAGGFDGQTSIEFCNRYPDYKQILFFEPCLANMRQARSRLSAHAAKISFYELGLSNESGNFAFNADAGSASAIDPSGTQQISVTTLDEAVDESVSFIKMDLEGWELPALEGCQNHISSDHPKLAISVYHRASDFWTIPKYLLSLRSDYRIYLRHYTEGWSETVMYFLPV